MSKGIIQKKRQNIYQMKNDNTKWIEEILDSVNDIKHAQMPQELDQKILAKIQQNQVLAKRIDLKKLRWIAAAAVLLVFVNFWVLKQHSTSQKMGMKNQKSDRQAPFSSGTILNM